MKNLLYTNEFLKKLEPFIVKNNIEAIQKIKETLVLITGESAVEENKKSLKLENIKTKTNEDIFVTEFELKKAGYNIFWTIKKGQKIIITLTKGTDKNFMIKLKS